MARSKRIERIAVLAGGPSSEREISLESGKAVFEALKKRGHDVLFMDIQDHSVAGETVKSAGADAAFIVLHGGFGEDGTMQEILKKSRIPFTGSGPKASRLALDKAASRRLFEEAGLKVPRYRSFKKGEDIDLSGMSCPLVVKPTNEGSSIGLSIVDQDEEIDKAVTGAFCFSEEILVEEFIKGRELTVGILDDEPLPVVEIVAEKGYYDFEAKYKSPNTRYLAPAPLSTGSFIRAQSEALKAHKALGCRSFSRVDMILGADDEIYVLEVNTIPGLTTRSLLPKAAQAAGIDFYNLCERILRGARI